MDDYRKFYSLVFTAAAGICLLSVWAMLLGGSSGQDSGISIYQKINPDTASVCELSRLPGLGVTKTAAIMQYRCENSGDGENVFNSIEDLRMVKGIGPKTAEKLEKWLVFE
jgi:competence protein ComEA